MKLHFLAPLTLALATAILAGCNASLVGAPAPALTGESWLAAEDQEAAPDLESGWVLAAFFSPT